MAEPFTSLRYPFAIDAARGRVALETDYADHVEQLVKQVLFTAPGQRINRPDFGCGVKRLVFAPNNDVSAALAQVTIYQGLNKWLSGVITVNDVKVTATDAVLEIRIAYGLRARGERRYLNLELTR